jgi:hypothetical protein
VHHYAEILGELVAIGVDMDTQAECALHKTSNADLALQMGAGPLRALAKFTKPSKALQGKGIPSKSPAPIDVWHTGRHFGMHAPNKGTFRLYIDKNMPPALCWAAQRMHPVTPAEAVATLAAAPNYGVSRLIVREAQGMVRDPTTGDTLFHVAARTGNMDALRALMRRYANPLLRNAADRTPLQEAANAGAEARALIREYAVFRPDFWHADWWGPYFCMRARAFLLVALRWRTTGVRDLGRDVILCVLQWVARYEDV